MEIILTELTGKWKVSQNEPLVNKQGIVEGLKNSGGQADKTAMGSLVAAAMES